VSTFKWPLIMAAILYAGLQYFSESFSTRVSSIKNVTLWALGAQSSLKDQ
jgi:hypothetical protein